MILSVSRRTDIPAFYAEWFMDKLRKQSVCVKNPFNAKLISKVKLTPENVDCIIFWTKDALPLMKHLDEIDQMGYRYYFQFTITPYRNDIERNLREKRQIIETFKTLSERIGKERVILRYDPILLTDNYNEEYHYSAFEKLCVMLGKYTNKIIFSFYDDYRKSSNNLKHFNVKELSDKDMLRIATRLAVIANKYHIQLETCAEKIELGQLGINHASCIDGKAIEKMFNIHLDNSDSKDGNREACGCTKCIDIGEYDTCVHDCLYCYANINKKLALNNYNEHNISSELMIGEIQPGQVVKERKEKDIRSNIIPDLIENQISLF